MCGISGFISKRNINKDTLQYMNDTMVHRGPDDSGVELYEAGEYTVGFAQRRLSILDLSAMGHQPMHAGNGRLSIVYNGEIYNFLELKEELKDYPFVSTCDTEVILAAYLKWGMNFINRIKGMFAIALYDRESQTVMLFRDRIGKKPLYYWVDGENLVFASELKPIMACPGFEKKIRQDILPRYLFQQCINGPETVFENVYKLEPGAMLVFDIEAESGANLSNINALEDGQLKKVNNRISIGKYWDVATVYKKMQESPVTDYAEAKETLKELLLKATKQRMIADVPLGSFLSGGYDSSLITALAQEISDTPVKTFSIGFNEPRFNEAEFAKQVANHLGTEHTELYIGEDEMFKLVDSIADYYDEPFADSSQIPSMLVAALAKKDVTVVLSGDGGDEFYCGYNIYENVRQAQMLDLAGGMVHGICNLPGFKQAGLEKHLPFRVRVIAGNRDKEAKTQFGASNYIIYANKMVLSKEGEALPCTYRIESKYDVKNWQIKRMLLDMDTYLPGDILAKVDRATMKYSLEARCPILDTDVMEYSFRLDHGMKFAKTDKGYDKKHILKDIAYDYIPREMLDRPKTGFGVPLDKWLRGPLKEQLLDYSEAAFLKNQGVFDADFTSNMVREYIKTGDGGPATGANYSKLCWSFFVFEQWWKQYFE